MPVISDRFLTFVRANLPSLVKKFGDPFIIHHGPEIRDCVRGINGAFQEVGLDFMELFALKANPRLEIFKQFIQSEGCGADCSSDAELSFSEEVRLPGHRVMLTANNVPQALYRHALRIGAHLNLDDITCIAKVPEPLPNCVSLRLNLGKGEVLMPGEEKGKIDFNREGSKFGIPIGDIMGGYAMLIKRGVQEVGSHGMMVSNNLDYRKVVHVIQKQFDILSQVVDTFGVRAAYVNIGGGLGIPYKLEDPDYDVKALARECARIAAGFQKKHGYTPKIMMESGRYVTGSSAVLVNKIENIYTKFGHKFLGVQIAMHAMPRPMLYPSEAYHHQIIVRADGTLKDGPLEMVSIVGAACEDNDRLTTTETPLPKAEEGEYVISCSAGAHCVDQASNYNWQFQPQELLAGDFSNVRRICSQQTYAGLTARQRGLEGKENILHLD